MMFKTHLVFGILLALVCLELFIVDSPIWFFSFLVFASILPDIDISKSKIGSKVKPLSWTINVLFGHRGIFHGIFMPLLIYIILLIFGFQEIGVAIFIGYVGHLFLDGLSLQGVKWLLPISNFRMKGFIRSGSPLDYGLMFLMLFFVFVLMF